MALLSYKESNAEVAEEEHLPNILVYNIILKLFVGQTVANGRLDDKLFLFAKHAYHPSKVPLCCLTV